MANTVLENAGDDPKKIDELIRLAIQTVPGTDSAKLRLAVTKKRGSKK